MQDTNTLLPPDETAAEPARTQAIVAETEPHEGYFQLVWRRFKRSKASILAACSCWPSPSWPCC